VETAHLGDFLVRRADGGAVFFFCNAVDDALMGVTQVLRGDDHLSNTPRQLLLLRALGLPIPRYGHLPLLLDAGGAPQSKRRGSVTLAELRQQGYRAAAVGNYLLRLGHHGAPDEWLNPAEFARHFHADQLGRAPAHFDAVQLPPAESMAAFMRLQVADDVILPEHPAGDPPPWMAKRPAGIRAFVAALRRHRVEPAEYASFASPVYFSRGSRTHPRWEAMQTRLASWFPDFTGEVFEGLHHLNTSHQAEPDRVAATLVPFWERSETARR
jgi:glutamyl-tRNA synthetase